MNLFGIDIEEKQKPLSLEQIALMRFGDDKELLHEINQYLQSRKQVKNYPSKIAWEMQLDNLAKIPKANRASHVRESTMKGYRSLAFDNSYKRYDKSTNFSGSHGDSAHDETIEKGVVGKIVDIDF